MAVTVAQLCEGTNETYDMKLIAGSGGVDKLVEWVHIVEDKEVADFLHGFEFVFTAGYLNKDKDWLLNFIKVLNQSNVSALAVNIGPYIDKIDSEVIKYCNEENFALYTIPWKSRLVDVTRDFCRKIISNEKIEADITNSIKDIIFHTGNRENSIAILNRYGYSRYSYISFVNITLIEEDKNKYKYTMERFKNEKKKNNKKNQKILVWFMHSGNLVLTLTEKNPVNVKKQIDDFIAKICSKNDFTLRVGVSEILQGFNGQGDNFEMSVQANAMAKSKNQTIVYYEKLGFLKILLNVKEKHVLTQYYYDVLGPLERYDDENETKLMNFLRTYLMYNGSPQKISSSEYIHRNTVNNQTKKIEKILSCDLSNMNDRMKFNAAFEIKELL